MKVYTEIVFQWKDEGLEKISEKSFYHEGPVSLMKGGGGETTQSNEPPAYLTPHLADVAARAQQVSNQPYFPDSTVTPFSSETEQALQMQTQRALGGSPLTNNAQSMLNQTISGEGYSQPWFDAQFQSAMNRINPQVNSTFSLAGRSGSGAHEAARTEALANAYGQFAGQERGRQMEAAQLAPLMAQQDYFDIGQLGQVGAQREGLADRYLQEQIARYDQPYTNLQRYAGLLYPGLGGGYGTTSTPYYQKSPLGPLAGAAGGFLVGGPAGMMIGSQLGGLL